MGIRAETTFSLKDDLFHAGTVQVLADGVARAARQQGHRFAKKRFVERVLAGFPSRELKQRIEWIVEQLTELLPRDFDAAVAILHKSLPPPLDPARTDDDFGEFIWVVPGEYVARHGCQRERLDRSLDLLRESTKRFSAECAIRPFLAKFPAPTLDFVRQCAQDDNYHVRRLASEGIRPLLPWAPRVALPIDSILEILDRLHDDATRYVTRSVANTLNDISKTHPDETLGTLQRWRKSGRQAREELAWMTRHALRTLVQGEHAGALEFLGYPLRPKVAIDELDVVDVVELGGTFSWRCTLTSRADQRLLIKLKVHFLRANGSHGAKVFAIADTELARDATLAIHKKVVFKPRTTRTLYLGEHHAELIVNGRSVARARFELVA